MSKETYVKDFETFVNESEYQKPEWHSAMTQPEREAYKRQKASGKTFPKPKWDSVMDIKRPSTQSTSSEPCLSVKIAPQDARKMEEFLKISDYYAEPAGRDFPYTWNFPEDEGTLDSLEMELRDALDEFGITSYSFESC